MWLGDISVFPKHSQLVSLVCAVAPLLSVLRTRSGPCTPPLLQPSPGGRAFPASQLASSSCTSHIPIWETKMQGPLVRSLPPGLPQGVLGDWGGGAGCRREEGGARGRRSGSSRSVPPPLPATWVSPADI